MRGPSAAAASACLVCLVPAATVGTFVRYAKGAREDVGVGDIVADAAKANEVCGITAVGHFLGPNDIRTIHESAVASFNAIGIGQAPPMESRCARVLVVAEEDAMVDGVGEAAVKRIKSEKFFLYFGTGLGLDGDDVTATRHEPGTLVKWSNETGGYRLRRVCPRRKVLVPDASGGRCRSRRGLEVDVCTPVSIAPFTFDDNTGSEVDLLGIVAEKLDFRTRIHRDRRMWFRKDGSGCDGSVRNGITDLGLGQFLMQATHKVVGRVDYTFPTRFQDMVIMARKPGAHSTTF